MIKPQNHDISIMLHTIVPVEPPCDLFPGHMPIPGPIDEVILDVLRQERGYWSTITSVVEEIGQARCAVNLCRDSDIALTLWRHLTLRKLSSQMQVELVPSLSHTSSEVEGSLQCLYLQAHNKLFLWQTSSYGCPERWGACSLSLPRHSSFHLTVEVLPSEKPLTLAAKGVVSYKTKSKVMVDCFYLCPNYFCFKFNVLEVVTLLESDDLLSRQALLLPQAFKVLPFALPRGKF